MGKATKFARHTERLPRWKDCLSFAVLGLSVLLVMLVSKRADGALWFGIRWGGITLLLLAVTAFRQRRHA
ncbi:MULTISPECIES: hypothetical protein [Burkholderia]|uniref:hypothetical protein n=1 Tax=Burkholderia TaxID=32008 RepID=UPI000CFF2A3F|nr:MULTISPECIES: hypothetical protein [Burkholderia]MBR8093630.1 hypothetical protein [Burkholderia cenocepacia]PRD93077.1 hypothetical protein C6P88_13305 [Burkholderia contaminans]